jgi:glycosyltransferase involved in cell wall biosynthesis
MKLEIPFYITIHDYAAICPQINLITSTGKYCNDSIDDTICNKCLIGGNGFEVSDIARWRNQTRWTITEAAAVICPSADVVNRLKKYIPTAQYVVVPHEKIVFTDQCIQPTITADEPLRVVILGLISHNKGSKIIQELVKLTKSSDSLVQFKLIGQISDSEITIENDEVFTQTGIYQDTELSDLINQADPHVILFSSICPETFSYTLSTAILSGRPIIVNDMGSLPERISNRPWSWVYNATDTPTQILDLLTTIRTENFYLQNAPKLYTKQVEEYNYNFYQDEYLREKTQ